MKDPLSRRSTSPATWAVVFPWIAGGLGVIALASIAFGLGVIVSYGGSLYDLGWASTFQRGSWYVSRVTPGGPADGTLQPGDRILEFETAEGAFVVAGLAPAVLDPDSAYVVRLERDGQGRAVTLRAPAARNVSLVPGIVVSFVISLSCLCVAMLLGFSRPELFVARIGCVAFAAASLGFLTTSMDPVRPLLSDWESTVAVLIGATAPFDFALGYHFYRSLPNGGRIGRFWHALTYAFYAIAAVFVVPNAILMSNLGRSGVMRQWLVSIPGPWFYAYMMAYHAFLIVSLTMAGVVLVRNTRATTDPDDVTRMRWIIAGLAGSVIPFTGLVVADFTLVATGGQSLMANPDLVWFNQAINGLFILIPASVGYSVLKHRVFGIDLAFRIGARYLLAKGVLEVVLALPIAWHLIRIVSNPQMTIGEMLFRNPVTMVLVVAAALSLGFRVRLRRRLDRIFFRDRYEAESILKSLVEDLKQQESAAGLSLRVTTALESALHPTRLIMLSRDGAASDMTVASGDGGEGSDRLRLRADSRLAQALEDGASSRTVAEAEAFLSPEERATFEALGIELLVPGTGTDRRLAGILLLGRKRSDEPYSERDRMLLETVASQMAIVHENAQLRSRVAEDHRLRVEVLGRIDRDGVNLVKECPACGRCFDGNEERCDRDGSVLTHEVPVERVVDGKYRLVRLLGRGGMGAVYEAEDTRLGRRVAVKVLIGTMFGNRAALRRFEREAQASARLNHANIVRIYDYGAVGDSGAFIVMEMLEGHSLRRELTERTTLPPAVAAGILDAVCEGVAAAHDVGVVHRDLKPENIVLANVDHGVTVKLLDFGLAKLKPLDVTATSSLTAPGTVMGTFGYMSPEQLGGNPVDERSDIFSIGIMAYEALVGRRPYVARSWPELIAQTLEGRVEVPGQGDGARRLERILGRCLAGVAMDRYPDVRSAQRDLIPAILGCGEVGTASPEASTGNDPTRLYGGNG